MTSILLVEDDRDSREGLAYILEDAGHTVAVAPNGREALNLLEKGIRPAVILLDLMMPVMNGWEFLEERRRRPPIAAIPVVVLTAASLDQKLSALGVESMRKPIDGDKLLEVVKSYG